MKSDSRGAIAEGFVVPIEGLNLAFYFAEVNEFNGLSP